LQPISIAQPSVQSLHIQPLRGGTPVASGTAFVVRGRQGKYYLITNRHNVLGRNSENKPLGQFSQIPDALRVYHNVHGQLGSWTAIDEALYSSPGQPRWLEHPTFGRRVDVIALELSLSANVAFYPHDQTAASVSNVAIRVTTELSIIGFPFGLTGGGKLGVWSRGTIATEPDIDFDDLPLMLIDSRTRQGQSGSPVIFWATSSFETKEEGAAMFGGGSISLLMGVYSGRVNAESDLGLVWKARIIDEIIDGDSRPTGESLMPE
jgi:hypothetical protein